MKKCVTCEGTLRLDNEHDENETDLGYDAQQCYEVCILRDLIGDLLQFLFKKSELVLNDEVAGLFISGK